MISAQIAELRRLASTLDTRYKYADDIATALRDAADTIWQLRDDLQRANADNAELREQMDGLASSLRNDWQIEASWDGLRRFWYVGWTDEHVESCAECAKGLGAYADSLCDPLKTENAKLRELAKDLLHDAMENVCFKSYWCDEKNWQTCNDDSCGSHMYVEIARELGIEVTE